MANCAYRLYDERSALADTSAAREMFSFYPSEFICESLAGY
jgi:hypothetical protein